MCVWLRIKESDYNLLFFAFCLSDKDMKEGLSGKLELQHNSDREQDNNKEQRTNDPIINNMYGLYS